VGKRQAKIVSTGKYVQVDYCNHKDHQDKVYLVVGINGRDYTLEDSTGKTIIVNTRECYLGVVADEDGVEVD